MEDLKKRVDKKQTNIASTLKKICLYKLGLSHNGNN